MDLNEAMEIIYLNNTNKKKIKNKSQKEEHTGRERKRGILIFFFFSSLLSQIYGNRTVNFLGAEGKVGLCDESYA